MLWNWSKILGSSSKEDQRKCKSHHFFIKTDMPKNLRKEMKNTMSQANSEPDGFSRGYLYDFFKVKVFFFFFQHLERQKKETKSATAKLFFTLGLVEGGRASHSGSQRSMIRSQKTIVTTSYTVRAQVFCS